MANLFPLINVLTFLFVLSVLVTGILRRIKPKIFVQIASYRDPECQYTVEDLFQKAKYHRRVNVGICWQYDKDYDSECFKIPYLYPKQVRVIEVNARDGKGVCWARNLTQSLYRGEKYTLVIDSHMRFAEGWDEIMINELKACNSKKAILSSYPAGYKPPHQLEQNPMLTIQRPGFFNKQGDIRFKGEVLDNVPEKPLHGMFLAAGFMFSEGKVIKEVPYDPYMYFDQEEISYALRLFTHGWDVYHPTKIMIYHYYKSPNDKVNTRPLQWEDNKDWAKMQRAGRERFHFMVKHKEDVPVEFLKEIEKYDLGSKRSLKEFETKSGIDFKNLNVSEQGLRARFIKDLKKYKDKQVFIPELDKKPEQMKPEEVLKNINIFSVNFPFEIKKEVKLSIIMVLPVKFSQYLKEFLALLKEKQDIFNNESLQKICITSGDFSEIESFFKVNNISAVFFNDNKLEFLNRISWAEKAKLDPISFVLDKQAKPIGFSTQRNASNHIGELIKLTRQVEGG